jgi:glycosyltransferase involved in cell wall biosynthesis
VEFLGPVSLERMHQLMETCDVFLFTSVRDTFGSVVLEAAAHKLAIIALNHQGVATWLPEGAAIKVPVEDQVSTVRSLTAAIDSLEWNSEFRRELGSAAHTFASRNTWERRALSMTTIYRETVAAAAGHKRSGMESEV